MMRHPIFGAQQRCDTCRLWNPFVETKTGRGECLFGTPNADGERPLTGPSDRCEEWEGD